MSCYVLEFQEIDQTQIAVVGGKGAHLAELSRIDGVRVPAGFCVTTDGIGPGMTTSWTPSQTAIVHDVVPRSTPMTG